MDLLGESRRMPQSSVKRTLWKSALIIITACSGGLISSLVAFQIAVFKANPLFLGSAAFLGVLDGVLLGGLRAGAWKYTVLRDAPQWQRFVTLSLFGFALGFWCLVGVGAPFVYYGSFANGIVIAILSGVSLPSAPRE